MLAIWSEEEKCQGMWIVCFCGLCVSRCAAIQWQWVGVVFLILSCGCWHRYCCCWLGRCDTYLDPLKISILFFSFMICLVPVILSYVCLVFNMWLEYPKLLLLLNIAWICYLNLVLVICLVCLMYFSVQSSNFNCYIRDFHVSYIHLLLVFFNIFSIMFLVENATLIILSWKNFVIFVVYFRSLWIWPIYFLVYLCIICVMLLRRRSLWIFGDIYVVVLVIVQDVIESNATNSPVWNCCPVLIRTV
jgi:hypothetical protein